MRKLMIAVAVFFLPQLSMASLSSSSISLMGTGEIKPQSDEMQQSPEILNIPLDKLLKNVHYEITCFITNNNREPIDIRFDINQPLGGGYGLFSLNNIELENSQGTIPVGADNVVTVPVALYGSGSSILFENLDFKHALTLNSCFAKPIVKTVQQPYIHSLVAYNDTNKSVEIEFDGEHREKIHPHTYRHMRSETGANETLRIKNVSE